MTWPCLALPGPRAAAACRSESLARSLRAHEHATHPRPPTQHPPSHSFPAVHSHALCFPKSIPIQSLTQSLPFPPPQVGTAQAKPSSPAQPVSPPCLLSDQVRSATRPAEPHFQAAFSLSTHTTQTGRCRLLLSLTLSLFLFLVSDSALFASHLRLSLLRHPPARLLHPFSSHAHTHLLSPCLQLQGSSSSFLATA